LCGAAPRLIWPSKPTGRTRNIQNVEFIALRTGNGDEQARSGRLRHTVQCRHQTGGNPLAVPWLALAFLQDQASTYREKFSISLTRVDGTIATISN
jgi:hypothetical protein